MVNGETVSKDTMFYSNVYSNYTDYMKLLQGNLNSFEEQHFFIMLIL